MRAFGSFDTVITEFGCIRLYSWSKQIVWDHPTRLRENLPRPTSSSLKSPVSEPPKTYLRGTAVAFCTNESLDRRVERVDVTQKGECKICQTLETPPPRHQSNCINQYSAQAAVQCLCFRPSKRPPRASVCCYRRNAIEWHSSCRVCTGMAAQVISIQCLKLCSTLSSKGTNTIFFSAPKRTSKRRLGVMPCCATTANLFCKKINGDGFPHVTLLM